MNLRQLRSLVTILDSGSFAAAGDRIGLSHAAISVQMQQLEATLAVDLFDRSSRPAKLTAAGVRIAHLAGEVLDKIDTDPEVSAPLASSLMFSILASTSPARCAMRTPAAVSLAGLLLRSNKSTASVASSCCICTLIAA